MTIPLITSLLILIGSTSAQTAQISTWIDSSKNSKYRVMTEGLAYEGFTNPRIVKLLDHEQNILWERTFNGPNFKFPIVSDNGIVTVVEDSQLSFFDSISALTGTYEFSGETHLFTKEPLGDRFWGDFSPDGKIFVTFTTDLSWDGDFGIICINLNGDSLWSFNLKNFLPRSIECFIKGIAIHAYTRDDMEFTNRFYFINYDGVIKSMYEPDEKLFVEKFYYDPIRNFFSIHFSQVRNIYLKEK
jgi:hypothetical protein